MSPADPRIVFLFNHDAAHQVAHLAGIAAATAKLHPKARVTVVYAATQIRSRIEASMPPSDLGAMNWHEMTLPLWARILAMPLDGLFPASRLFRLRFHRSILASADAVVSTERTCLRVRRALPEAGRPMFIRVPHGSGDRNVTFHPEHRQFDLSLVAGRKLRDQLVAHGIQRGRIKVVGYSKFEQVDLSAHPDPFGNGRPTFVYNPHFDPHLSSWYDAGPDLLRWFARPEGQRFNLIFAPHVMLFRKTLHISPEYSVSRRRPGIPAEALQAENILIDTNSPQLFDMSHLLAADAYIGDASSQLYEFLIRPRPVFVLDPRGALKSEGADKLRFLNTGPVAGSASQLAGLLGDYESIGKQYRPIQETLRNYTFDIRDRPASERAANAIVAAARERSR